MDIDTPGSPAGPHPDTLRLTSVLENCSDAIVFLDRGWRYTYVNHAAELLLRRKRGDLVGRMHWEEYPDLVGTPAEGQLRGAADSGRPVNFEQFIPGLYAWHSVLAVPSGEMLLLFIRDITDRMRALREEAVREGLRNILEHVPVGIMITRGSEHRIELQNTMARQIMGGRDVEGLTVSNAVPGAAGQGFIDILNQVYATGMPVSGKELPIMLGEDAAGMPTVGRFNLTYQPIFATDGRVSGVLQVGVDVTLRLLEKDMLASVAAERDAILRQLSEGVILTDAGGKITFINEAAHRLHGVAVLDVDVGDYSAAYHLLTVDGAPYPPEQLPLARAVLHNETTTNARWRIVRPDGSDVVVEGSAQPVIDERGVKIACVLVFRQDGRIVSRLQTDNSC